MVRVELEGELIGVAQALLGEWPLVVVVLPARGAAGTACAWRTRTISRVGRRAAMPRSVRAPLAAYSLSVHNGGTSTPLEPPASPSDIAQRA